MASRESAVVNQEYRKFFLDVLTDFESLANHDYLHEILVRFSILVAVGPSLLFRSLSLVPVGRCHPRSLECSHFVQSKALFLGLFPINAAGWSHHLRFWLLRFDPSERNLMGNTFKGAPESMSILISLSATFIVVRTLDWSTSVKMLTFSWVWETTRILSLLSFSWLTNFPRDLRPIFVSFLRWFFSAAHFAAKWFSFLQLLQTFPNARHFIVVAFSWLWPQ